MMELSHRLTLEIAVQLSIRRYFCEASSEVCPQLFTQ